MRRPLFVDAPVEEGQGAGGPGHARPAPSPTPISSALTDRAAHALRARGVEPEQRVALLLPDGPAWAATFFAALKLGAVAVPLNTRLAAGRARGPSWPTAGRRCWSPIPRCGRAGVDAARSALHALDFDALRGRRVRRGAAAPSRWAATRWPSGSTPPARPARPKAAVHCHRTLPPAGTTAATCSASAPRRPDLRRPRSSSSPMPSAMRS